MKCLTAALLPLTLSLMVAAQDDHQIQPLKPQPVGVVYLIQLLSPPQVQEDLSETRNAIASENIVEEEEEKVPHQKVLLALEPNKISRDKRSPSYGGGGGCNRCGGGGGHGGGGGGGGYPGGGGGHQGGGGYGGSGSWASSSSSAGSYGSGGGYGKGK